MKHFLTYPHQTRDHCVCDPHSVRSMLCGDGADGRIH